MPKAQCPMPLPARYTLGRAKRLHGSLQFAAVFKAKARKSAGPLAVLARPNNLSHPRLGLSVSRRVGNAVKRNRIKRLLREAFRFSQHDWPRGYDLVIIVHPHRTLTLAEYQRLLFSATRNLHLLWEKRLNKNAPELTPDPRPLSKPDTQNA